MRAITVTFADGRTATVELDPGSTLHVTGRTRAPESGSLLSGRTGVQVQLRDVVGLSLSEESDSSNP